MCKSLHINPYILHGTSKCTCLTTSQSNQCQRTALSPWGQFQSPKEIAAVLTACFRDIFPKQHSMIVCAHHLSLMLPAEQNTHISHPSSLLPPCGNSRASLGAGLPWATRWIDPSELHHLGALSLVRWMAGTGRDVEPHQGRRLWSWMPLDQRHGDHGYAALPDPKPNCSPLTLRPCSKHEFYGHQRLPPTVACGLKLNSSDPKGRTIQPMGRVFGTIKVQRDKTRQNQTKQDHTKHWRNSLGSLVFQSASTSPPKKKNTSSQPIPCSES